MPDPATRTTIDTDRARRLVRQAAETSRLLGVNFVPCYRTGESDTTPEQVMPATDTPTRRDPAQVQHRLDEIRDRYQRDAPHKAFVTAHTKIVFGDGDPCARLMFIGEAPGAEEDRIGIPFVGRAGQLLNKMIDAMGLSRQSVYIANVLKTRPPNNATPTIAESLLCAPYLYEQIQVIQPEVIVTLGLPAARIILDSTDTMGRLRGRWGIFVDPADREVPVMPTYHPAYLLRSYTKDNREKVCSDLQQAMERLGLPVEA